MIYGEMVQQKLSFPLTKDSSIFQWVSAQTFYDHLRILVAASVLEETIHVISFYQMINTYTAQLYMVQQSYEGETIY